MATFAFSGAVAPTPAYGQKHKVRFVGTWADDETWSIPFTSTLSGDFTVGVGNIAGRSFTSGFKLRNRVYVGFGSSFALSENGDPTHWEEQNTGSAVIQFLSQYGPQDEVVTFAAFEGKLVVFGKLSIQIWQIDADPGNFILLQTLDNSGTDAKNSVQAVGDLDVIYLDYTGIRSIRSKFESLNAYTNDIGIAIDTLIQEARLTANPTLACAVVEPSTKQYWLYLGDTIYVLSIHPGSKILAWSTFKPTFEYTVEDLGFIFALPNYSAGGTATGTVVEGGWYSWTNGGNDLTLVNGSTTLTGNGQAQIFQAASNSISITGTPNALIGGTYVRLDQPFTPQKFVVHEGQVYVRTGQDGTTGANRIFRYGGSNNDTYDRSIVTAELPWLDFGDPSKNKQAKGIDVAMTGAWSIYVGLNPRGTPLKYIERGSSSSPSMVDDSTFDIGHFSVNGHGTHVKFKAVSGPYATEAKLGKLSFQYNPSNDK